MFWFTWSSLVSNLPVWPWLPLVPDLQIIYLLSHFLDLFNQFWMIPICPPQQNHIHRTEEKKLLKESSCVGTWSNPYFSYSFLMSQMISILSTFLTLTQSQYSQRWEGKQYVWNKVWGLSPKLLQLPIYLSKIRSIQLHFPPYDTLDFDVKD